MTQRKVVLATNEIYHVFNRSVGKEILFPTQHELRKILEIVSYYRFPQRLRLSVVNDLPVQIKNDYFRAMQKQKPLVSIYVFAFMPNHFHFLLKQLQDNGIRQFISAIEDSFAKRFNRKFDRHGSLFTHPFQARWIETDEEFLHVSRYGHLNPVTGYIIEFPELGTYPYTSFPIYMRSEGNTFIDTGPILNLIGGKEKYATFVADQVNYQRTLDKIKHLIID